MGIDLILGWKAVGRCCSVIVSWNSSSFFGVGREKTNGKLQTLDDRLIFHIFHTW